ncbi:MAG: PrsW family intramembrane metalloprotease [Candidatus Dormiibacterota bacterium]
MPAVSAAYHQRFRPPRYLVGAGIAGFVVLLVVIASLASAVFSGALLEVFLYGLPAVALLLAGTVFAIRAFVDPPGTKRADEVRAGVLLGLGLVFWLLVAEASFMFSGSSPAVVVGCAIACLPTTGFGLWFVRRLDRNEKEPWRLVLVAAVWGAIVATTMALWGNTLWDVLFTSRIPPGSAANVSVGLSAGDIEEISKGLAVLLLYLVVRDEFDGVVDGIIYGAIVGLGFNYMESILYMSRAYVTAQQEGGGGTLGAGFQWFIRQVLDLFFGHATYTALTGAGIGLARQMARRWPKVLMIVCGFVSAIAAHLIWDAWVAQATIQTANTGVLVLELIVRELAGNAGFTAVVILLLGMGLRAEGDALAGHLEEEAELGAGAVLPQEVRLLRSPWRRLVERSDAAVRGGPKAWLAISRLRTAQLDLAMERWHRERKVLDAPQQAEDLLRRRVLTLRQRAAPSLALLAHR